MFGCQKSKAILALVASTVFILPANSAPGEWKMVTPQAAARAGAPNAPAKSPWEQTIAQGEAYLENGNVEQAEQSFLAAKQLALKYGPFDPRLAITLNNLGLVSQKKGKYSEADILFRQALQIDQKVYGNQHANISRDYFNLAVLKSEAGKFADAEKFFQAAIDLDQKMGGPEHPFVAIDLEHYAAHLRKTNRNSLADQMEKRAVHIKARLIITAAIEKLMKAGEAFFKAGKFQHSEKVFLAAHKEAQKLGPKDPLFAATLNSLGAVNERLGRYAEAEKYCLKAFNLDRTNLGDLSPEVGRDLNNLAVIFHSQGKNAESERAHKMSLDLHQKVYGRNHIKVANALKNYAALLKDLNRPTQAARLEKQADQIIFKQRVLGSRSTVVR